MTTITNEAIANGAKKFIKTFEQIEKMAQTDGSKESALKLIQEVYPGFEFHNMNALLYNLQISGYISGLTYEDGRVVEPIRPVIADKAKAEIEAKKEIVAEYER